METIIKKIRLYALIGLAVVILESFAGFSSLYTGVFYREYDEAAAKESLTVIQEVDPNYYALLNDPEQPEFMNEFMRLHTKRGNISLISFGAILIIASILSLIPVLMILSSTALQQKSEEEEKQKENPQEEVEESF